MGGLNASTRTRRPFLRLWPNGQLSLSYKHTHDAQPSKAEDWAFLWGRGVPRGPERSVPPQAILVSAEQSSQSTGEGRKMRKYGLKGITPLGQKKVKSAAYLMQRKYGRVGMTFMTITVPSLPLAARRKVAQKWGEIMRQVLQQVSRKLRAARQPSVVCSVTELQSARADKSGEAYLHAHLIFPARKLGSNSWAVDVVAFRSWFKKLIERVGEVELEREPRVETKLVKKSAENYLGKYMSKGSGEMEKIVEDLGEESVPGQQWNMTKQMRDWVTSEMVESSEYGDLVQLYIDMHVAGISRLPGWWHRVEVDIGGRTLSVCWIGKICEEDRAALGLPELDTRAKISINRNSRR